MNTVKIPAKKKTTIALFIAILFHVTGLAGIIWVDQPLFASLTALNMLVMLGLIFFTQEHKPVGFYLLLLLSFLIGYVAEVVGTSTGLLFGNYRYGSALGIKLKEVPLLIGVNWFIIIYCCGTAIHLLHEKIKARLLPEQQKASRWWRKISIIVDGAMMAVFFDWVMEPVAVELDFWQWLGDGSIPQLNYISWFAVSLLQLLLFTVLKFNKNNYFALHLFLIQLMFFLILRTLLLN